ncbi:ABC transporter ATP-binding protein [uncultured Nitratireductor sp.]|uniref:ABC transporter ATP-binding protein n=1 Tax=uncultured Nitratireductor sp. TaxID=520953 RepID=UPI0025CB87D1|nr:ABC transporter ATP-binding protein [uncultured Nitratireductor sp.]
MRRPAPALQAVRNVSLALREGETLGIVGESGCGKSTLARLAVGLQTPDEGSVAFGGKLMTGPDPDGRVQMVFQDPYSSLNPRMTIGAQLDEVVARYRPDVGRRERTAESRRLLDQVGMPPDAALKYPHALSGGQRQRVSIARALCPQPQVLVADEPVSALDASVQAQIINLFQRLSAERGIAIIFISHDMQVIRHLCDRVAVMYLGEVVELQAKAELFERPLHPYTRGLIDAVPDVTRRGRRSRKALSGEIPDPFSTIEGCRFSGRCPMAEAACSRQQTLRVIDGGGAVRCWKATPDPR